VIKTNFFSFVSLPAIATRMMWFPGIFRGSFHSVCVIVFRSADFEAISFDLRDIVFRMQNFGYAWSDYYKNMLVNKNLKFLRTRDGLTQKQFAEKLSLKQSVIGAYEEERAMPPLACLLEISELYKVSMDVLTRKDLSKLPEKEWKSRLFERGADVLAITVDKENRENVELVTQKASAGYLNGYQDVEFISELPRVQIPVLPRHATYRAFEIKGDSMLPVQPGSIIFGEYVDQLTSIKNGSLYIVVSKQEGIVFKRVFNFLQEEGKLLLVSDNKVYEPFALKADDVLEVWAAKGFFSTRFPDVNDAEVSLDHLAHQVLTLQQELQRSKKK
jgi:transcriptional regulator with XRE-family HTH domain